MMNNVFGNFRTRTFSEIFTNYSSFKSTFEDSGIPLKINNTNLTTLYYLLYARYGNSHIASTDENRFKYALQSRVFMYGPTWEKRVEIQDKVRALTEAEILKGGSAVYNTASAPGTELAGLVNSEGKVDYISGQNTTDYRRSLLEGYAALADLLETDVSKEFIDRFQDLFIKIVEPYSPLWYETEVEL